jgi:signal transduction histidine kinase
MQRVRVHCLSRSLLGRLAFIALGTLGCYALVGLALERIYQEGRAQTDEEYFKLMRGPAVMIEAQLRHTPRERWPELLGALQRDFDYELRVKPIAGIKFMPYERLRVMRGEIARGDEDEVDTLHYRIGDTDAALAMGPIWATPVKNDYLNFMSVRLLATVTLMILLAFPLFAIWAWLAPARRDLAALRGTLRGLVNGEFGTQIVRVESRLMAPLTDEVNCLAANWRALVDSQRELSRAVSHELRTPVARLRFGLALLDEQARAGNERVLDSLERSLTDLEDLVECSLTYARYTQAQPILNLDERALRPWVEEELAHLQAAGASSPQLVLRDSAGAPLHAMFDAAHMKFVLRNLVANALRFAASRVEVTLSRQDGLARIDVDDDGPGVPDADRQRIFEPFVRGRQPPQRPNDGHGLGLSIAARIVAWHGGRIELARSPACGARFSVLWPLDPADLPEHAAKN